MVSYFRNYFVFGCLYRKNIYITINLTYIKLVHGTLLLLFFLLFFF